MQLAPGIATAQVKDLLQTEQQESVICGCKFNTLNKRPIESSQNLHLRFVVCFNQFSSHCQGSTPQRLEIMTT